MAKVDSLEYQVSVRLSGKEPFRARFLRHLLFSASVTGAPVLVWHLQNLPTLEYLWLVMGVFHGLSYYLFWDADRKAEPVRNAGA